MEPSPTEGQKYLAIGQITGAHGIRGEVKVALLTDFPERYRPGAVVYLGTDAECVLTKIEGARPHKEAMLVKLSAVPDRTAAEALRGQYLLIPEAQAMPLGEHENYAHDLIGLTVETAAGETLGTVSEVLFTRANDVYVVAGPSGELLLPALREVILQVDLPARKMMVALPEGLLATEKD